MLRPSIVPVNCTVKPANTCVNDATMATLKSPVSAPAWYSSQPMEGGLAQASPSISVPVAYAALPAPRHGEAALKREALASCGSSAILPIPTIAPVSGEGSEGVQLIGRLGARL